MMRSVSTPARMASGLPPKVVPWLPGPKHVRRAFGADDHGADRHARAQALGQRHHVGLDAGPLVREPLAGAADAALHLVEHQQPVVLVAQRCAGPADSRQRAGLMPPSPWIVSRKTATTFGFVARHLLDRGQVVQRHAHEAFDQRAEAGLDLGVAGGRQGGDRAAVEGLLVDDDLGPLDALVVAELARDLQRRLVGLQAGVAEEGAGQARDLAQLGRQLLLQRHLVVVGAVDQLGRSASCSAGTSFGWAWPSVLTAMPPRPSRYLLALRCPRRQQPWPCDSAIGSRP